jgi:hypothetical protein
MPEPFLHESAPPPPAPVLEPVVPSAPILREAPAVASVAPAAPAAEFEEPAQVAVDDLEIPAFMRRERRMYQ